MFDVIVFREVRKICEVQQVSVGVVREVCRWNEPVINLVPVLLVLGVFLFVAAFAVGLRITYVSPIR
jgi:hypothetical protein